MDETNKRMHLFLYTSLNGVDNLFNLKYIAKFDTLFDGNMTIHYKVQK
jgi:hypothetical protein